MVGYSEYEFLIWNESEDREATTEEAATHIRLTIAEDGSCKLKCESGYSIAHI